MMRFDGLRFRARIMLHALFSAVLAILLGLTSFVTYDLLTSRQAVTESVSNQADYLAGTVGTALAFDDRMTAREMLETLENEPNLVSAVIRRANGEVFVRYDRPSDASTSDGLPALPLMERLPFFDEVHQHVRPLEVAGERIGDLTLTRSLADVRDQLEWQVGLGLVVLLVSLFVTSVTAALIARAMSRPVDELVHVVERVSAGLDARIRARRLTGGELGVLTDGFNEMLDRIDHRNAELQRARDDLEIRVEARTQDLARSQKELVRAIEDAQAANAAKGDFLANMSHEIRTPLNGVIGMADILSSTDLNESQAQQLEILRSSAETLLRLLNDILDFSKIEAGRLDLESIPFSLRDELGDAMQALSVSASAKGLELAYHIAPDIPEGVLGDPTRLRQIVTNLVGNAIKFTEQGEAVVEAELTSTDGESVEIHFSVRDTGPGIPARNRALIFESFSQADSSMGRRYGGTGLGLAISKELTERMGGRIWLESEVGRGSTFHFSLPFPIAERLPRPGLERSLESLSGVRVLAVDDNLTNGRILQELIEGWGMRPEHVRSGEAALSVLRASQDDAPFSVVLLDAMMPGMDGLTLAREIRADPALRELPLLMLSSAGPGIQQEDLLELRIARRLNKPAKPSDLLQAIATTLDAGGVLPVDDERPASSPRDRAERPLRLLLVEDGLINQRVAVGLLEQRGHAVVVAGNGREALERLDDPKVDAFDVVLMDVQMPEMDGFEATAEIRSREAAGRPRIPVIAMTAHAMKGDRARCLEAGMDDYVSKPLEPTRLFAAVEGAVTGAGPVEPKAGESTSRE